jgi:1-acyl-sn-glycerol-3-phosphate acyltransferase
MEMKHRINRLRKRRAFFAWVFYPRFIKLLRPTLGLFLKNRYRMGSANARLIRGLKPPYVVLSNHGNFWDPFFVSAYIPYPIYWIASDAQFRGYLRYLLQLVGAVPKSKVVADIDTIHSIMEIRKNGGIIGIFPEGVRTWDGHFMGTIYATSKLIKLLKIPVVIPVIDGAYLAYPRWARNIRKGQVTVTFKRVIQPEEIRALSVDEIHAELESVLDYDVHRDQLAARVPFKGKRSAETLELTLFVCPACESVASMKSAGDQFFCRKCGYRVRYDEYGFLEKRSQRLFFPSVHEWNEWQLRFLRERFEKNLPDGRFNPFFSDSQVRVWMGFRSAPLKKLRFGRLTLYSDRIEFGSRRGERFVFPVRGVEGINVQHHERLEFYFEGSLFQFRFRRRGDSAYKYQEAVKILNGMEASRLSDRA